jgi:hypothetical protein
MAVPTSPPELSTPRAGFSTDHSLSLPARPTPLVQRRPEQPGSTIPAPAPAQSDAAEATSTHTVGLAEMFALAAAQAGAAEEPAVQRSAETEIQLAAADTGPAAAAPSAPAPGGTPAAGGPAGADLDEMARRLYEPLSARLRAELWQDRERSGLLTDLRP